VLIIHGGGWTTADKRIWGAAHIQPFLDAGVSVVAINYRLIQDAMEQRVEPPVKACLYDAARAIQTIRSKSKEWNINPKRIAATGGSAGACTALWLAMHDDLADPAALARLLEAAAAMSEAEYAERASRTREELATELEPIEFYAREFRRLAHRG
jgi:acetyl esterase/lipase